jgi:hypothetical protein
MMNYEAQREAAETLVTSWYAAEPINEECAVCGYEVEADGVCVVCEMQAVAA